MHERLINVSVKLTRRELKELRRVVAEKAILADGEHVVTVSDVVREALDAHYFSPRR